jgi:hypothetical protein
MAVVNDTLHVHMSCPYLIDTATAVHGVSHDVEIDAMAPMHKSLNPSILKP